MKSINKIERPSLGILTVATNIYINYWRDMVLSLDKHLLSDQHCVSHVFTDQPEIAKKVQKDLKYLKVKIHEIPAYGWPDATLRRYEIFSAFATEVNESVVMHLDADMLVLDPIFDDIIKSAEQHLMVLVAHPGFWRKKHTLLQKIKRTMKKSNDLLGSWEKRTESCAYVSPNLRKTYVCGGVWAGSKNTFFVMTNELAASVIKDRDNQVMAVWHDESHLNRWAAENEFHLLTPAFCFVSEYGYLKGIKPKILAVTKELRTR